MRFKSHYDVRFSLKRAVLVRRRARLPTLPQQPVLFTESSVEEEDVVSWVCHIRVRSLTRFQVFGASPPSRVYAMFQGTLGEDSLPHIFGDFFLS